MSVGKKGAFTQSGSPKPGFVPVSEDQPLFSPSPRQTLKMDLVIPWKESLLVSSDNFSVFSEIGRVLYNTKISLGIWRQFSKSC